MNPLALRLASELGGTMLSGPSAGLELLLVERIKAHGLPQILVAAGRAADLMEPLAAVTAAQKLGIALNLVAVLPLPDTDLGAALRHHRRRLGALLGALDVGLPWLDGRPMLPKRMPGKIFACEPHTMDKAPLSPIEKAELKSFLPAWDKVHRREVFRLPRWQPVEGGFTAELWPGVVPPPGTSLLHPSLILTTATPLSDILRAALRTATGQPIPLLPQPGDPRLLHALGGLGTEATAFQGPEAAWLMAFKKLAALPAPPHFCARC